MQAWIKRIRSRNEQGQSLVETAFALPILLGLAFNIINFGYFWFMVLALSAAPRMGAQYSAQGSTAQTVGSAPSTTQVSNLVFDNMTSAVHGATSSNTAVRVCASNAAAGGVTGGVAKCDSFGASFAFAANADLDPESPAFVANRVDVEYTVTPIIPGGSFNVIVPGNMQFKRHITMRSLF